MSRSSLVLLSSLGTAARRGAAETIAALTDRWSPRIFAPASEAQALREIPELAGVPIEVWKPSGLWSGLRAIGTLRRAIERDEPEVVHAFGFAAATIALGALPARFAARTIAQLRDPLRGDEVPKRLLDQRMPALLRRAGALVVQSPSLARAIAARFNLDLEKIEIIPPGIDAPLDAPLARPSHRLGPIVGFAQPLVSDGAWEMAIDALAAVKPALPDASLWIGATGPLIALAKAHARHRDLTYAVTFIPELPLRELFRAVDLLVVPRSRDTIPYELLDALVCGVPVVAANEGALADFVMPFETGWLVPGDAEGIAKGIEDAWAHIDQAWDGAATQRVAARERFDPEAERGRIRALYERLAASVVADV